MKQTKVTKNNLKNLKKHKPNKTLFSVYVLAYKHTEYMLQYYSFNYFCNISAMF